MYKVLVVEDEIPVRTTIIESVDWQALSLEVVYAAGDGQDALEYLDDNSVDLILTDIYMPFMDGMELIRRVRQTNSYCKVVFLTGYNEFDYAKEAVELNASKYLLKPITKEELTNVLIEMKEALDEDKVAKKNLAILEKEYEKSLSFLRDKLLHDIISGFMPEDRIDQACANLSCDFGAPHYRIGIIEVVGIEKIGQEKWNDDYSLLHFAMFNICKEIFSKENKVRILLGENGKIIIVFTSSESKGFQQRTHDLLSEAMGTIRHIYNMPLTAGLSSSYEDLHMLKFAYKEATSAIDYSVLEGYNRVIIASDIEPQTSRNHHKLDETLERMLSALKVNDMDGATDGLKMYFEHLKFDRYSLNETKTLILSMITKVYDTYNQACLDDTMKQTLDFKLVEKIYALDSIEELTNDIQITFMKLRSNLEQSRADDKMQMVHKAMSIISESYSEPDLDLTGISDRLHVSTSHFSRTFKMIKEQTFIEYLTAFRMEQAKTLLKTTDMKVYEIASQVGYDDAHYFSYNFRKNVGTTPLKYRKS